MKEAHCKYDEVVNVRFNERTTYAFKKKPYEGPRQILCPKQKNCDKCCWNPAVEEQRKGLPLETVRGYVNSNGDVVNRKNNYQGIVIRRGNESI